MKIKNYIVFFLFSLLFISSNFKKETVQQIQWLTFEQAIELHKKQPKKLLIDVYTDWCGWCKHMDKTTYQDPNIIKYVTEKFYCVKLDGEQTQDIVFNNHTFRFIPSGRKGYHELAAALMNNKLSYPTTVFLTEQLEIIQPVPGYLDVQRFDVIVHYFGEEKYKTISWEDYQKSYNQ